MSRSRRRLLPVLLGAGAMALLSSGCASTLGMQTPCAAWLSMDNADQQGTIINMIHENGGPTPDSSYISSTQRLASDYCEDPYANDDTIGGMVDSRAS
jgi:hypothetical protein